MVTLMILLENSNSEYHNMYKDSDMGKENQAFISKFNSYSQGYL